MDVLIDVRCLQDDETLALLRHARAALPGRRLIGLVDPARAVPDTIRALLDAVRGTAYTGAMDRPTCLVQPAPLAGDPIVLARALLHPEIPTVAVGDCPMPPRRDEDAELLDAVARHWAGRYDRVVASGAVWAEAGVLRPLQAPSVIARRRARVAVLTRDPDAPLCAGLRAHVAVDVFAPGSDAPGLEALPLLSPRFDRVVSLIANTSGHAPLVDSVVRLGGGAVVEDACLMAAYAARPEHAAALASAEIGRRLAAEELGHWMSGAVRTGALMLGELASAAEPLIVHGARLAGHIRQRYGRDPVQIPIPLRPAPRPRPAGPLVIAVHATPRTAEACVWALECLRFWGVDASFVVPHGLPPHAAALAHALGLAHHVIADATRDVQLGLFLALPGEAALTRRLAEAACSGLPCVASSGLADGFDAPDWVHVTPEGPSPVLVAEAVLAAAASRPDPAAVRDCQDRHHPERCARLLCEALGITA